MQVLSPSIPQATPASAALRPDNLSGLTSDEVTDRVRRGLTNKFQPRSSRTYREILFDNLINVFNFSFVLINKNAE